MKNKDRFKPTEAELEILQVLWQNGDSTVRAVHEALAKTKDVGYTTTLKLMQNMNDKGLVSRDTSSRMHIYSAEVDQQQTSKLMVSKLINGMFSGSASRLVLQALGEHSPTEDEIKEIKSYLDQIEKQ